MKLFTLHPTKIHLNYENKRTRFITSIKMTKLKLRRLLHVEEPYTATAATTATAPEMGCQQTGDQHEDMVPRC